METEETTGTAGNNEDNGTVPATETKKILSPIKEAFAKMTGKNKNSPRTAKSNADKKNHSEKPSGQSGFDPKNREVSLTQKGEKFTVTKAATGFTFTGTEKKAKEVYKHQLNCSHN